ncbi:hypothetical protein SERLA73DRAFT_72302 [Serpula lacrymans var. lacrymans S7.3]|uniref:Uncharacterized protein n=2 Tax=Serpula lacrymans var. lacrymans TaxID=341189 RepID=F8PSS9_SERL3|nr:uncharacterized protein SERLADRAFT_436820 [Serpula lacrymans var. lacrymans S7.9]EGO01357.1 hypothetical protein SERLA73DRAFT_72302 [Serpula lacrymans var. lacrymans S7.3]EGO26996.1 hypothetical protein SERLADRAFT_436820 [Serpula lacrymans var. lacrymans S7.9]
MVLNVFMTKQRSKVQGFARSTPRVKVKLSKEARAALTSIRRERSQKFKNDLEEAWEQIDRSTATIAAENSKSIQCVRKDLYMNRSLQCSKRKANSWNAFCWKKSQECSGENKGVGPKALQNILHAHTAEYHSLSDDEKKQLLVEYSAHLETKKTGFCMTTKSRINDVTETLKIIENELESLRCRTGIEVMLYVVRGSTDLPLRGVTFSTEGIETFMRTCMGINNQDLLSKMEGFAIQGIAGAAKNHQQHVAEVRATIRAEINMSLRAISGDQKAKMQWTQYWRNIIQRYQVKIEGWPENIPFGNLSRISSALPDLEMLLRKWQSGATYWKNLTDEEFKELSVEHDHQIESGDIQVLKRRTRSDKGEKRAKNQKADDKAKKGKTYKSAAVVDSSSKDEAVTDTFTVSTGPATTNTTAVADKPAADTSTANPLVADTTGINSPNADIPTAQSEPPVALPVSTNLHMQQTLTSTCSFPPLSGSFPGIDVGNPYDPFELWTNGSFTTQVPSLL